MAGKKKIKSVVTDPRWADLVRRYRYDWATAAEVLFGKTPTWQQEEIINAIQEPKAWVTVASGHGTGKSDMTSIMILLYLMMFPNARVIIVANKIGQVMTGVFKYLKINWKTCVQRFPWLQNYFVLTDTSFYEITSKGVWTVIPKGFRMGNEEALAGEHAEHLFYIIDEASGVGDKAFGVITGALTQADNRLLLLSQPTRPGGYFYDSHHRMAIGPHNPEGLFTAITLNSEESPLVEPSFIKAKLVEYGGRDAMEYLIKVRGMFPSTINGFLLSRDECERAQRRVVKLAKGWGWMACCDVGNGRDKSVLSIFRVSGYRQKRRVVPHKVLEMESNVTPVRFADIIYAECNPEKYPNISIVVDGDGVGGSTAELLETKHGVPVQRIRWGKKMHSREDKSRFVSQRAFANIMARDAIKNGRMRLDKDVKSVDQASKIPVILKESGQWKIEEKPVMKRKYNINSPDRWDTYCFAMIADFNSADDTMSSEEEEFRESTLAMLD